MGNEMNTDDGPHVYFFGGTCAGCLRAPQFSIASDHTDARIDAVGSA